MHFTARVIGWTFLAAACLLASCNDAPNTVGTELVPGTDTLYAISSLSVPLISEAYTSPERIPLYNPETFLYGKASDSEGRLFIEFINYIRLGAADSFEVIASDLVMYPEDYKYGDTSNLALSISGYELKQLWYPQATWDSIWAPDGSTSYYSPSDPKVCSFESVLTSTDSIVYVPFNTEATKRWIVLGSDSSTRDQLFGLVLLPEASGSVRSFRNQTNGVQNMKLRVIYKHADSADNDTTYLRSAVANFVDTPLPADSSEPIVQGARVHRAAFKFIIDSLPPYSIILGSMFQVFVDDFSSTIGTLGRDELFSLSFTSASGANYAFVTRGDASGVFSFPNITSITQTIRKEGGSGTIFIEPEGINKFRRMNRLKLFNMQSDSLHRPRLDIIYAIPTVYQ
ncbi:MAG: hypothetical protein HYX66_09420 [Ignavibacteria bacterium]|nr:hypothetical protein [Ignavibacteria bacterium]